MEFLTEYGLFLAKIVTFVVAALVVISVIMSAAQKDRGDHEGEGELKIRKLNEKYEKYPARVQTKVEGLVRFFLGQLEDEIRTPLESCRRRAFQAPHKRRLQPYMQESK